MRNFVKKTISVFLLFILCCALPINSSAKELTKEEQINYLTEKGIPYSFFVNKESHEIESIYRLFYGQEVRFLGSDTISLQESNEYNSVSPLAIIPESDMTLTISKIANVSIESSTNREKYDNIYIFIDYFWLDNKPFIRKTDGISVNWDSSLFTFKNNSFVAYDYKITPTSNGAWMITNMLTNPTALSQGGLGYYAEIAYSEIHMGITMNAMGVKGSAYFVLLPCSTMYTTQSSVTSINVEYVHDRSILAGSVSFEYKGMGVSVNPPNNNSSDSVAKALNVYYN